MENEKTPYDLGCFAGYNDSKAKNPFDPDSQPEEFGDWQDGFENGERIYKETNPDWDKY